MTNKPRQVGTGFETDVKDYLNAKDLGAERTGSAAMGMGDINFGMSNEWTLEAKAEQAIDLPGYLRQLAEAVERRDTPAFKSAAVVKNRRHSTGDAYAVMSLLNFRRLAVYVSVLEMMLGAIVGHDLSDPEVFRTFILANDEDGLFADD